MVTYLSPTLAQELHSRNLEHIRAFGMVKDMVGTRPLVLDRECSYLALLLRLWQEGIRFVIRLHQGAHPPKFFDAEGREVVLTIAPGQTVTYSGLRYKGMVPVNVAGIWRPGLGTPLWVATNLEAQQGLALYLRRM